MTVRVPRVLVLIVLAIGAVLLLGWLATTQGPLAPTRVTLAEVERGALVASTFGIGTVEARRSYALGPTVTSRVARVLVEHGDTVATGQLLAELDPIDLDDRIASARLGAERASNAIRAAEAVLAETRSRAQLTAAGLRRYVELRTRGFVSQEAVDSKQHEANAAGASVDAAGAQLTAARRDHERALSDAAAAEKLRAHTRLTSPVDGIVSARLVEPGSTIVAGQPVVQVIDPATLWIKARIDQRQAGSIRVGQPVEIALRSDAAQRYRGEVQRIDWVSDPVAEERIVHVGFATSPQGIAIGELVEVTISTSTLADAMSIPTAALKRHDRQSGVWQIVDGRTRFQPLQIGITTLDGRSQILDVLKAGDRIVEHSEQPLKADAKVKVVGALPR